MDRTFPCEGKNAGSIPAERTFAEGYSVFCGKFYIFRFWLYIYVLAPIVEWIQCLPPKEAVQVRFLLGAPDRKSQRVLVRLASLGD